MEEECAPTSELTHVEPILIQRIHQLMTSSVEHDEVIQILLKLRELLVRSLNIFTYMIAMLRLGVLDLFAPEMEHVHHVWRQHFAWLVAY
jgi:hypothetical protein